MLEKFVRNKIFGITLFMKFLGKSFGSEIRRKNFENILGNSQKFKDNIKSRRIRQNFTNFRRNFRKIFTE